MRITLIFSFLFISMISIGQNDQWVAFLNSDSTAVGYMDSKGNIMKEAGFSLFQQARKVDYLLGVYDNKETGAQAYYMNKEGKKFGFDSLVVFDFMTDCESEGFIRFHDANTDKYGLFNRNGIIAVPGQYDWLTEVRSGLIIANRGAVKKYLDDDHDGGCNHYSMVGGRDFLIDTSNRILIEDLKEYDHLNLASLKVSDKADPDPVRISFKGKDGQYYSFINYLLEFEKWIKTDFLESNDITAIKKNSFPIISVWRELPGWSKEDSEKLIISNRELILSRLAKANDDSFETVVGEGQLNNLIQDGREFEPYYNNCGDPLSWKFPVFTFSINLKKDNSVSYQFHFLRTADGYKLIEIGFPDTELN